LSNKSRIGYYVNNPRFFYNYNCCHVVEFINCYIQVILFSISYKCYLYNNLSTEYDDIKEKQDEKWRIQRCTLILEYQDKGFFPLPFRLFYNIYILYKFIREKIWREGEKVLV
jgi:hypothetical protein